MPPRKRKRPRRDRRRDKAPASVLGALRRVVSEAPESILLEITKELDALQALAYKRIHGGAKPINIDLDKVTELARLGMKSASAIARCMRINKETILGPAHRVEVLEAIERGRALFEMETLQSYDRAVKGRKFDKAVFALLIFKAKQIGWSDRQVVSTGQATQDVSGARERLIALVERFKTQGRS